MPHCLLSWAEQCLYPWVRPCRLIAYVLRYPSGSICNWLAPLKRQTIIMFSIKSNDCSISWRCDGLSLPQTQVVRVVCRPQLPVFINDGDNSVWIEVCELQYCHNSGEIILYVYNWGIFSVLVSPIVVRVPIWVVGWWASKGSILFTSIASHRYILFFVRTASKLSMEAAYYHILKPIGFDVPN